MDVTIACGCPPLDGQPRHASDTVTLHEPIDPRVRRAVLYDVSLLGADVSAGDQLAVLSEGYVLRCIDRWTLEGEVYDEKAKKTKVGPLPPSRANIRERIIDDAAAFDTIAKAADELYSEAVLLPLTLGASSFSSAGQTNGSMSPATNGATSQMKRSGHSSITSIPTDVTGPMPASSAGDSSS